MAETIQFNGAVLTGPDTEVRGLWSVGGRLTFRRPAAEPDRTGMGPLPCGSFVYDHTGAPAGAEIGLAQPATVEPVRVMPAKEVSSK